MRPRGDFITASEKDVAPDGITAGISSIHSGFPVSGGTASGTDGFFTGNISGWWYSAGVGRASL